MTVSERPAGRAAAGWGFDVFVALLAGAAALPFLFHDNPQPPPAAFPVLVVLVAPLVARRRFPVPVLAWLVAGSLAAAAWNHHVLPGFGVLIALYTLASIRPRRDSVLAAAVLEAIVVVAAVALSGADFWYDAIFVSGLLGAAVGLGLYASTRRAYLAELHDRAERLERERDQQGELAAAAERARISREMHDVVAHHLTVMVALSDGAIAASATSPQRGVEVMRTVSATGRRALADTRRLLGVLRHDPDGDRQEARQPVPDLAEIDHLLDRVRAAGLPTTFEVQGVAADVPAGVQLTAYRLVQEALTNTLKHGGTDARATVRLQYLPHELHVEIVDDGVGASAPAPAGVGAGLAGMRERVYAYGGDVSAWPGRHRGWRVAARLRLDEMDPA
ncbi:MAG: sensor histidine kinase [Jatrophihabitans sp.]